MKDDIENFEHYYKLRISYQVNLKSLTIENLGRYRKAALEMISEGKYISGFELERLHDFVDEVEVRVLDFDRIKKEEELKGTIKKKNYQFLRTTLESEEMKVQALCENIYEDSNGDIVAIVKKENKKDLSNAFERIAIISSIISTKNFTDAAKMLGLTVRAFRHAKRRHGI